jgi:hypothetical protein
VTAEIFLLALASSVRPTSLAAVYALLGADQPRRLMIAYVASGLVFTVGFGLLVVAVFHGVDINAGTDKTKAIAEIAAGILILGLAVLLATGRIGGPQTDDAPDMSNRWKKALEQRLTLKTALAAGPLTHIPGLFYLAALNVIVAHKTRFVDGMFQLLLFNAIWFLIPIGALAICFVQPDMARQAVGVIADWTKQHTRSIVLVVSFGVGTALVVRGLLTL